MHALAPRPGGPGPPRAPLPLAHIYMHDPGLQGPRNAATPPLEDGTPTVTTTPPAGAVRTPARSLQGRGRCPGRLPRPTPCPTVYFPQCSTTAPPRFGEKTMTSTIPCACTPSLLVSIKGGGWLPLKGDDVARSDPLDRTQHSASLSTRYWHLPQSTSPLEETWELPSLSRLACTPYYKHPRCKIVQCSRTPLCWTYGSTAGTRINPCVTVLPLASTI